MNRNKTRKLTVMISVIAAVVMVFILAGVSYAAGGTDNGAAAQICVDGYVINHREVPVDGTQTTPPLMVTAEGEAGAFTVEVGDDGYFVFDGENTLTAGDWNFKLPLPEDWDSLVPPANRGGVAETGVTMLEEQDNGCYTIVFKIRRLFDVTVIKWEELLDGTVQPGTGWEITFDPQGDPFVGSQTKETNGSGGAVFTVTPGAWLVTETVKDGWTPVTPPQVYLELDQYAPPGAMDPVVFKNREPPCTGEIIVEKTGLGRDANGGLVWLGPLAGWDVTLSRVDGAMTPETKTTDASGRVTFEDLLPGVYEVEEHMQTGWKAVSDNPQVVVHRNCETTRVLFENEEISGKLSIHGKKLYQAWTGPADGLGLSGWVITATLDGTDISVSTTTNALGEYWFEEAMLDEYGMAFPGATIEVCEEERENWIPVTPVCQKVTFPYPVPPDYEGEFVDFVNVQDPPMPGMANATTAVGCRASYRIMPGDNLYGIALRYGSSVNAIARASGLSNPNFIRSGATLCIP